MDRSLPVLLKRFSPANDLQTLSVQFTEIARAALYEGTEKAIPFQPTLKWV